MSLAVGAALAASMQRSTRRIIALLSDAECNEGVVWEAAMFAAHHRLENLTVMIDYNRQQAFGYTAEVLVCEDMAARWAAFGWDVVTMNGHDEAAMATVLGSPPTGRPRAIVAETTFGKGVSYMEGQIKWHYLPMTDAEYAQALREIGEM
jgi:transketolase